MSEDKPTYQAGPIASDAYRVQALAAFDDGIAVDQLANAYRRIAEYQDALTQRDHQLAECEHTCEALRSDLADAEAQAEWFRQEVARVKHEFLCCTGVELT